METLVIHTENKYQLAAMLALVKSWNIVFEKYPYSASFVAEIKSREANIANGQVIKIKDPKNIWDSMLS